MNDEWSLAECFVHDWILVDVEFLKETTYVIRCDKCGLTRLLNLTQFNIMMKLGLIKNEWSREK